jgi:hypothetical protein
MIHKSSEPCCIVRLMFHTSIFDTLKTISFAWFYCIVKYGVIWWEITACDSREMITVWKKIVRFMVGAGTIDFTSSVWIHIFICGTSLWISNKNSGKFSNINTSKKYHLHKPVRIQESGHCSDCAFSAVIDCLCSPLACAFGSPAPWKRCMSCLQKCSQSHLVS